MNKQKFSHEKFLSVLFVHAKINLLIHIFIVFECIHRQRDLPQFSGQIGSVRDHRDI